MKHYIMNILYVLAVAVIVIGIICIILVNTSIKKDIRHEISCTAYYDDGTTEDIIIEIYGQTERHLLKKISGNCDTFSGTFYIPSVPETMDNCYIAFGKDFFNEGKLTTWTWNIYTSKNIEYEIKASNMNYNMDSFNLDIEYEGTHIYIETDV